MNESVEYIISVILKAQDRMSAEMARAAEEIRLLDDAADGLDKRLDGVNKKVTSFNTRVGSLGNKMRTLRQEGLSVDQALSKIIVGEERAADAARDHSDAIDSKTKAEAKSVVASNRSKRATEDQSAALKKNRQESNLSKEEKRKLNEEMIKSARAAGMETQAVAKLGQELKELQRTAKTAKRELARGEKDLGALRGLPDQDPAYIAAREREVEALRKRADDAVAAREAKRAEMLAKAEQNRQIAAEAAQASAQKEVEAEGEVEAAVTKTAVAKTDDTKKSRARTRAIDEETTAKRRSARASREEAAAEETVSKAKTRTRAPTSRPTKERLSKDIKERIEKEIEVEVNPEIDGVAAEVAGEKAGRIIGKRAAQEAAKAWDEELLAMGDDEFDIDTGMGLGGGAPRPDEEEFRRRSAERDRAARDRLRNLTEEFGRHRTTLLSVFREYRNGDIDLKTLVFHLGVLGDELDKISRRSARLGSGQGLQFASNLREAINTITEYSRRVQEIPDDPKLGTRYAFDPDNADAREHITALRKTQVAEEHEAKAAREAGRATEGMGRSARRASRDIRDLDDDLSSLTNRFARAAHGINNTGESVAALDNRLRGLLVLAIMAFAQQLITVLVGLGGALISVGSSAIFAGGALGGALVSGIAQALPMVGLLVAAFARVKDVMDVVKQSDLVDQQRFARQAASGKKLADTTDAVANAQDGLRAANERLAQAHDQVGERQEALTKARVQAREELENLMRAEEEAALRARRASLAQGDAQEALRMAVQSGDVEGLANTELDVVSASLDQQNAERDLIKARRERQRAQGAGIGGNAGVVQARKQLDDARKGVQDAERAVEKASRGIDKAGRNATAAAADTFAGAEKLDFLLKQLTPAERNLYEVLKRVRQAYRENFRPITDIFVNEFAEAGKTVERLLEDPRIIRSARGMATGITHEMSAIRKSFTDDATIDQFTRIAADGRKNLAPLSKIVQNLGHAFLNIAEEAGPALRRILGWFRDLSGRIEDMTEDSKTMGDFFDRGADHLIAWLDTTEEIVKLFATIAGIGESSGFTMIQDLGNWARETREEVKGNREEVAQFFEDSRRVLYTVLRVLGALAKAIIEVFDADRIETFANFLINTVIPGLERVIKFVGAFTSGLFLLLDLPIIRTLGSWGISILLFSKVVTSSASAIGGLISQIGHFLAIIERVGGRFGLPITRWFDQIDRGASRVLTKVGELIKRIPGLGRIGDRLSGIGRGSEARTARRAERVASDATGAAAVAEEAAIVAKEIQGAFVAGAKEAAVILREGILGGSKTGSAVMRTSTAEGGTAAGIAIKKSEIEGGTIAAEEIGAAAAGGAAAGGGVTTGPGGRRRRFGRRLLTGGALVAGGALALAPNDQEQLRGFDSSSFSSSFNEAVNVGQGLASNALNFDIGGTLASLNRGADNIVEAVKGIFGGDSRNAIKEFKDDWDASFAVMLRERNTKGLEDLADRARKLTKAYPELKDALEAAATQADKAADHTKGLSKNLKDTEDVARRLGRRGIHLSVEVQGANPRKLLEDFEYFLKAMRQGLPATLGELHQTVADQIARIQEAFTKNGRRTPEWYEAMAATYKAAIKNIKDLRREGKISGDDAQEMIRDLRSSIRNLGGDDSIDVGKMLARKIIRSKGDRRRAIRDVMDQLDEMPIGARKTAAAMMIGQIREMEKKRPALRGVADDIKFQVGRKWTGMRNLGITRTTQMADGMGRLLSGFSGGVGGVLSGIGGMLNKALGALGIGKVEFAGISQLGKKTWKSVANLVGSAIGSTNAEELGMATGGWVGRAGERGRDMVRTWLGRGEYVLNWGKQQYLKARYGVDFNDLDRIKGHHAGGYEQPGYARAGMVRVPGDPDTTGGRDRVNAAIARQVAAWIRRYKIQIGYAYDPGHHQSPGHNVTGTALDVVPGPGGNWDLLERGLRAFIAARPGQQVLYGTHGIGTPYKDHGRGNHAHVEWGLGAGGVGGVMGEAIAKIAKITVNGPDGGMKRYAQAVIDRVRRAANRRISREESQAYAGGGGHDYSQPGAAAPPGQVRDWLTRALRITRHFSQANLNALYGRTMQESGGNPRAINLWDSNAAKGMPSKGLIQTIDPTFQTYRDKSLPNNIYNPVANAVAAIRYMFAKYGHIVGPSGTGYQYGGAIPGFGGGDRHPILTEGGEHVWTKDEVAAAGGHRVMYMLRRLFGRGGQGGPTGYAEGGQVLHIGDSLGVGIRDALRKAIKGLVDDSRVGRNSDEAIEILKRKLKKAYRQVIFDVGTNDASAKMFERNLRRAHKAVGEDRSFVVATMTGGRQAAAKNRIIREFAERHGNVTVVDWAANARGVGRDRIHPDAEGYAARARQVVAASREGIPPRISAAERRLNEGFTSEAEKRRLAALRKGIYELPALPLRTWEGVVREINRALKSLNVKGATTERRLRTFDRITREGGLFDTMEQAREKYASSLQRATARATYKLTHYGDKLRQWRITLERTPEQQADRALDEARANMLKINEELQDVAGVREKIRKRLAVLRRGGVKTSEAAEVRKLETYLSRVNEQLASISDQQAQALENVYQAQVAAQQARVDAINNDATRASSNIGLLQRLASGTGNIAWMAQLAEAQRNVLSAQADRLSAEISRASAMGNTELANQLTDQVADLRVQIWESIQQSIKDAQEAINNVASRRIGRIDLFERMLTAIGSVGLAGTAATISGEQFTRGNLFQQRQTALETQRTGLQGVLRQAEAQQNTQLIQDLTDQLAELDVAIAENTRALFDARVGEVNDTASRRTNNLDLLKRIVELKGAINGSTDNMELLRLEQERTNVLQEQRNALEALLAEAQANNNQEAINNLSTQLLENQIALLENTQAINELNGVTSQPQTFSSSAWQWFREAIFNGMGQVMPSYVIPGAAAGGIVTKSGIAYVHAGEPIVPAEIERTEFNENGGDHNEYHFHSVDGKIDMTEFAATAAWAKKTAQG